MNKAPFIAILLLSCSVLSCGNDEKPQKRSVPPGLLSKDSMAYYLAEVHLIDATMRNREVRKRGLQMQARQAMKGYFDTASVSKDRFTKSLNFWKDDFDEMVEVYDLSMEILSTKLARIKLQEESREAKDTLKTSDQPAD